MAGEGQILQQRSSYRRGIVLGLTMAEIMVLLVFCLLIAMAAFLKREETRRIAAEQELKEERAQNEQIRDVVNSLSKSAAVAEKIESLSGLSDPQAIDQYWRELVDSRSVVKESDELAPVVVDGLRIAQAGKAFDLFGHRRALAQGIDDVADLPVLRPLFLELLLGCDTPRFLALQKRGHCDQKAKHQ